MDKSSTRSTHDRRPTVTLDSAKYYFGYVRRIDKGLPAASRGRRALARPGKFDAALIDYRSDRPPACSDDSYRSSADGKKAGDVRAAQDQLPHLFEGKRRFDIVDLKSSIEISTAELMLIPLT
jgi:hypothetical protein